MVVKVGKAGSICLYWKDLYITSIPVHGNHEKTFNREMKKAKECLRQQLYRRNIKEIIHFCYLGCNTYRSRAELKKKLTYDDRMGFHIVLFILLNLQLIEKDDVILYCSCKKLNKDNF